MTALNTAPSDSDAQEPTQACDQRQDAAAGTEEGQLQLVTFQVGAENFGIDILTVQEIIRMMPITCVPQSPPCVEGVLNLRGRMIPIVDLRKRFDLPVGDTSKDKRIVVVDLDGRTLGFIVDRVDRVFRIDASIIEPSPESDYVRGVGKLQQGLLILLDLPRLFVSTTTAGVEARGNGAAETPDAE
ncbi:MAG: chemotaxis protein CheW [Phycisphaeraceae bacterium]